MRLVCILSKYKLETLRVIIVFKKINNRDFSTREGGVQKYHGGGRYFTNKFLPGGGKIFTGKILPGGKILTEFIFHATPETSMAVKGCARHTR